MRLRLVLLSAACLCAFGADIGVGGGIGKKLAIQARLYTEQKDVAAVVGQELEEGIVVAEVTATPRGGEPVKLWREDFFLRSDKDGQRAEPYDPGQLAGDTVLVVSTELGQGGVVHQGNGPVFGDPRSPSRLPGGGGMGGTTVFEERNTATMEKGSETDNPLLAKLRERVLKEEEITEPTTGLLYFLLEGKHKTKQLWLHYRGNDEKIDIQFSPLKNKK